MVVSGLMMIFGLVLFTRNEQRMLALFLASLPPIPQQWD